MATASLLNFTVPLSDVGIPASGQGLLMPKLAYRFRALFIGFGTGNQTTELTKQVMNIKRPSLKFDEQTIDVYGSKVHYAGKPAWDPTDITLRDDMLGEVSALVGQQVQKQFDFANQSSASSATDYKFEMLYEVLDGGNGTNTPVILETYDLVGCWLTNVDYSDNDYSKSDPLTIKMTVRFDNALQSPLGIGSAISRTLGTIAI